MKRMLWIVTFAICTSAWANAQTIADVARQERAKQKDNPKTTPTRSATITKSGNKTSIVITGSGTPAAPANSAAPATAAGTPSAKTSETPTPTTAPAATPASPDVAAAKPAPEPAPAAKNEKDEKWWRDQFEKARTEVRRAENQAAVAQLELNAANRDYLTRAYDPDGRGPTQIGAATAKLDATKKNLDAARAKVTQLEEELRRAGAPAGWAR